MADLVNPEPCKALNKCQKKDPTCPFEQKNCPGFSELIKINTKSIEPDGRSFKQKRVNLECLAKAQCSATYLYNKATLSLYILFADITNGAAGHAEF